MSDDNQILRLKPFVDLLMELCHNNVVSTLTNNIETRMFKTDDALCTMHYTMGGYFESFITESAMYLRFNSVNTALKIIYQHNRPDNVVNVNPTPEKYSPAYISELGGYISIEPYRDDKIGVLSMTLLDDDEFSNTKEFSIPLGLEEGQFFQYSTIESLPLEYNDYVYITSFRNLQKDHTLRLGDYTYLSVIPQLHLDDLYQTLLSQVQSNLDCTFDLR